jgi:hypothetical protein
MPTFHVTKFETHEVTYSVEAQDALDAFKNLEELANKGMLPRAVESSYYEDNWDIGMSLSEFDEQFPALAEDERKKDLLDRGGDFFPTIRSIDLIEK